MIIYLFWYVVSVLMFYMTLGLDKKSQMTYVTIFLLSLGVFVGLGDMLGGYDRYIYGDLFDGMANVTSDGGNPWTSSNFEFYDNEFGYGSLCAVLTYITENRYIFIFIATMLIYVLLITSLRRYVDNAPFAVVMFMGLWFFFSFTYIRQVIGCTIIWLSVKYIIERDLKRFLLICFISYSFHNSAIVFIPMYFLPVKKYSPKSVLKVMTVLFIIGLTPFPRMLFAMYGDVGAERANMHSYTVDSGFRWEYLFEAIFFLYIILQNYKYISNKAKDIVMLNISLVFCAILLIFIHSDNGGRLGWFFMIGVFCTMSNICISRRKLLPHGTLMLVVSFFLFFRILDAWSFNLTPYKTFLTPGHTAAEFIYEEYEYDTNYDYDKFYRPAFRFWQ